ncbi:MAG: hypothetical protein HQK63_16970 [Desulfamplus sp.]|nr:hypothetical protein [Desulfamplus sp.]
MTNLIFWSNLCRNFYQGAVIIIIIYIIGIFIPFDVINGISVLLLFGSGGFLSIGGIIAWFIYKSLKNKLADDYGFDITSGTYFEKNLKDDE